MAFRWRAPAPSLGNAWFHSAGRRPVPVQSAPPAVRVFLVDDHEVVRRGVAEVLEDDPGITVAGEAGSVAEALARVPAVRPDVVLIDMRLPDGNGADLCRELRTRVDGIHCLVLTSYSEQEALEAAVRAGAAGFLLKQVRGPALVSAVRTVAAGGTLFDDVGPAVPRSPVPSALGGDRMGLLTDQERTVLRLIGEGLTNRQIGARMGLAEKTVKNYTSHLLAKLGLERRTQAAILATQLRDRPAD
ncbi:response regulator transcription factor [Blastococcus sp. CT_GayMR20]|nr:response regulator transcription factor [Blastococcus sp. CT_GayMR20]